MGNQLRRVAWTLGGGTGAAALLGAGYLASTWYRYGRATRTADGWNDSLLDRFIPTYDVAERHEIPVAAPASFTFAAAREMDLHDSRLVRAIFRGRELLMRSEPHARREPRPLLTEVQQLGWGLLAVEPWRQIVVGAITRPWEANVHFQTLPPDEFAAFAAPGYAKIVWTLRAEPTGRAHSMFRTETRVATTDGDARKRFRRYWTMVSPGVRLIRHQSLRLVRAEAERQYQACGR